MDRTKKDAAGMTVTNKDLIESFKLATMRDDIGLYGQRLLLLLIDFAMREGAYPGNGASGQEDGGWEEKTVTLPMRYITQGSDNRSKPKAAVRALMQKIVEAEDKDDRWVAFPFLTYASIGNGEVTVKVRRELWRTLMDFSKGFRRFELNVAIRLKSTYSLRLYILVSEQEAERIDFRLDDMKRMLGLKGKYDRPRDFIEKVVKPAKAELDAVSPWTFTYETLTARTSAKGRAGITGLRLFPVRQADKRDPALERNGIRRTNGGAVLPMVERRLRDMLTNKFGFTRQGILNNIDLLSAAAACMDLGEFLERVAPRVSGARPRNVPGYVIAAIKDEMRSRGADL